jgi:serine/threonine protein kinase
LKIFNYACSIYKTKYRSHFGSRSSIGSKNFWLVSHICPGSVKTCLVLTRAMSECGTGMFKCLGKGAFGSVYLYTWENKQVAIKLFDKHTSVYDADKEITMLKECAGSPYVVKMWYSSEKMILLEYCAGGSLETFLTFHNVITTDLISIMDNIRLALVHLHNLEIAHRDVKPANILVSIQDQERVGKLGDFGLAAHVPDDGLFMMPIGTPYYMAPEVSEGALYTLSVDIYSFGITMREVFHHREKKFSDLVCLCSDRQPSLRPQLAGVDLFFDGEKELAAPVDYEGTPLPTKYFQLPPWMRQGMEHDTASDSTLSSRYAIPPPPPVRYQDHPRLNLLPPPFEMSVRAPLLTEENLRLAAQAYENVPILTLQDYIVLDNANVGGVCAWCRHHGRASELLVWGTPDRKVWAFGHSICP